MGRVAFYTFGILRAARGDDEVQGFFDRSGAVGDSAAEVPGYLGRSGGVFDWTKFGPRFFIPGTHAAAPQTLSLWSDLEAVHSFAYRGLHAEALRLRREWFLPPAWPTYAIWWVGDDEAASWPDALRRLERLHDDGPTPFAFNFRTPFDQDGQPTRLTPMSQRST